MRYSKMTGRLSLARNTLLPDLAYILVLLCAFFLLTACARPSEPTVPDASTAIDRSNASTESATEKSVAVASDQSAKITSVPAPQSQSATAVPSAPTPTGTVASSAPESPFGPPTLDERIFVADVIAIVRPISVEPLILTLKQTDAEGRTLYSPVVQTRYKVVEYLKGEGDSELVADAKNFNTKISNADQALQIAESKATEQLSGLGSTDAVVFLRNSEYQPDIVEDINLKVDDADWRQHTAQYGVFSMPREIRDTSTNLRAASALATQNEQVETFSLATLRGGIETMEALLREGEGIDGYKNCISSKLRHENFRRKHKDGLASVGDVATFESGMPVGSVLQEFSTTYPRQWFTGANAPLFHYGSNEIATTRPTPDGAYVVNRHFQKSEWIPCDYVPPPAIWRYTFQSAADVLHEAFFDPVVIEDAVGTDSDNGVLKPDSFDYNSAETAIERIQWDNGQVSLALSSSVELADHRIDFIVLDGSISLRLDFTTATKTNSDGAVTLTWGVCEQPWEEGDLLMLRIAEGIPEDGVVATNDSDCQAASRE